jgi:hypothetical protein
MQSSKPDDYSRAIPYFEKSASCRQVEGDAISDFILPTMSCQGLLWATLYILPMPAISTFNISLLGIATT